MKISKIYSKVLVLLLALCVTGSIDLTARAASSDEKETYTVRLFSGAHSTLINGSEMMSYEVAYDSPLPFSTRDVVQLGAESKYYVKDIRESGKDNAETLEEGYRVREDGGSGLCGSIRDPRQLGSIHSAVPDRRRNRPCSAGDLLWKYRRPPGSSVPVHRRVSPAGI